MGDVNWSETKAILLELEQLFKRDDDVNDIDDIKKMSKEIDLIYENNLKSTKELIKDMTARVAEKEKDIIGIHPLIRLFLCSIIHLFTYLQLHQKLCMHPI